jgi:hypothetical protein
MESPWCGLVAGIPRAGYAAAVRVRRWHLFPSKGSLFPDG